MTNASETRLLDQMCLDVRQESLSLKRTEERKDVCVRLNWTNFECIDELAESIGHSFDLDIDTLVPLLFGTFEVIVRIDGWDGWIGATGVVGTKERGRWEA